MGLEGAARALYPLAAMDQPSSLSAAIALGADICRSTAAEHQAVIGGLFLTGLAGSLTHCVGMCAPFVLSQVTARLERIPAAGMTEADRWRAAALVPYHLGRLLTYAALGAVAAGATGTLAGWQGFNWLAAALLCLAALFIAGMALPRLREFLPGSNAGPWAGALVGLGRGLLSDPSGWRGLVLGILLGFIPCGLLYAALAAAAATGDALGGAFAMLAFGAGTVPLLLLAGILGQMALARLREPLLAWAPLLLAVNALALLYMAWRMVA